MIAQKSLTEEKKKLIYEKIHWGMSPDDRLPGEVIREDFNGEEETYLLAMAEHLDISLD